MSLQKTSTPPNDAYIRRRESPRKRAQAILDEFIAKSLPPLPAVPGIPGWTRWLKAITNIEIQMTMIAGEMENYRKLRSKEWKDNLQGYVFDKKLEELRRITDDVAGWPNLEPDAPAEADEQRYDAICANLNRDVTHQDTEGTGHASA